MSREVVGYTYILSDSFLFLFYFLLTSWAWDLGLHVVLS